jgi:hypothetical protein
MMLEEVSSRYEVPPWDFDRTTSGGKGHTAPRTLSWWPETSITPRSCRSTHRSNTDSRDNKDSIGSTEVSSLRGLQVRTSIEGSIDRFWRSYDMGPFARKNSAKSQHSWPRSLS